jgi:carbohydrate kinase (thermoresistant glucokinase family)
MSQTPPPTILVMMGVSGSGKTTIGARLASRLGWSFKEGDELHPAANVAKMKAGHPLDDADRVPWLAAVGEWIDAWRRVGVSGVITCSALKRVYRHGLARGRPELRFVFLKGDEALVAGRLAARRGHFMSPSLLASQFADLEEPTAEEGAIVVEIDQPIESQVEDIAKWLAERCPTRSSC